jgi:cytochrome c oxidase cbb3-type subunit IV
MDINILRSAATLLSLLAFLGIVFWAWSKRRYADFSEAANLPFEQENSPHRESV